MTRTRLVIELKRDANAQVVLNQLYKHTPMQTNFAVNMLALVDGVPAAAEPRARRCSVYVEHQVDVVTPPDRVPARQGPASARTSSRASSRALDMIDEIIALIRGSADADAARAGLMAKPFEFCEIQANHILDMQLRRLAQLEGQKLRDELDELAGDDRGARVDPRRATTKLRTVIKDELAEVREKFADERRTRDHARHRRHRRPRPHRGRRGRRRPVGTRATSRRSRPTRSASRVAAAGACAASSLKDEDYVEHLLTTTRTRTCCSSRTAAGSTGCARTRSR